MFDNGESLSMKFRLFILYNPERVLKTASIVFIQLSGDGFQEIPVEYARNANEQYEVDVLPLEYVVDIGATTREFASEPCDGAFLAFYFCPYHVADM